MIEDAREETEQAEATASQKARRLAAQTPLPNSIADLLVAHQEGHITAWEALQAIAGHADPLPASP